MVFDRPAIVRATSAGIGEPSSRVPGRSESPVRVRKGTVATVAACCDSHHWLVGMRSFTQYSTGPKPSPESGRKAEPIERSSDCSAFACVCAVVSELADEGPAEPACVGAVRATDSAKSASPASESAPGAISPSSSSSGASFVVCIPVTGSTETTLTLSSGTGLISRSYWSWSMVRSSLSSIPAGRLNVVLFFPWTARAMARMRL